MYHEPRVAGGGVSHLATYRDKRLNLLACPFDHCLVSTYSRHMEEDLLAEARRAKERLIDAERDADVARADFHRAVRRLHLHGASLRELAGTFGLSHQRVHQIVAGGGDVLGPVHIPLMGPPHAQGKFLYKRVLDEEELDG